MIKNTLPAFIAFFLLPFFSNAQSESGAFNQSVDAAPYLGKKFRIEAAVKVKLIDTTAEAEVWVRVDRPNKQIGYFYNMMDKPIRSADWKVYSIEGKIAKDATRIFFGGLYHRKGIFYYDDFRLFVEIAKDKWEEIVLPDGGFESDSSVIKQTWKYTWLNNLFEVGVTKEEAHGGKHSFRVDGKSAKRIESYGKNSQTGKFAIVNNINIYYETYGKGEPLLLLHGNSSSIKTFEKQIPELSKHFMVIAVDSRGQGKSTEDGKLYTYDLFAEDMNALLDHLHLDSVNILGWSDGGNTGLIMAMKYPTKVKKLVTMGANVFIDNSVVDKWIFKTLNKEKKELSNDAFPGSANRLRLINLLLTEPKHSFEELRSIHCPVLVIAGEKDVIKEGHTKSIAAAIPHSTLLVAPKETHYFPTENPAAFNKAVIDFLQKKIAKQSSACICVYLWLKLVH